MSNPYKQYQKTSVTTASREKILLMLYEGCIRFVKQAILATEENRVADKGKYVSKATAIISELMATLDFKVGGQIALDLENLYVFMIDKMIEGNIENNVECFRSVEKLMYTLHVAWKDVIENPRADGVTSPTEDQNTADIHANQAPASPVKDLKEKAKKSNNDKESGLKIMA